MANIKITDLTAYTDPLNTDVLPIVDVTSDTTKKVSIADLLKNAGSGTAAAPGIAFDGDSNTGIYRPGANQLAISTNGTGRLFVDANGNVGLGTATQTAKLELSANNNGVTQNNTLRFIDTDGSFSAGQSPGRIEFVTSDADNPGVTAYIDTYGYTNAASDIVFGTGIGGSATERLRITYNGKLGLGTSAPGYPLTVLANGGANTNNIIAHLYNYNAYSARGLFIYNGRHVASGRDNAQVTFDVQSGASNGTMLFQTDGNTALTIDGSQRVGIGAASPSAILHTVASASFDPTNVSDFTGVGLFLQSPSGISGNGNFGSALAWSRPEDNSRFKTAIAPVQEGSDVDRQGLAFFTADDASALVAPEERLRISNTGNVGVGTTTPDLPLTIKSLNAGGTGASIRLVNPSTTTGSTTSLIFTNTTSETANSARIDAVRDATGQNIVFSQNDNERVRIDSSGRLGLGTSSPQVLLHGATSVSATTEYAGVGFLENSLNNYDSGATTAYPVLKLARAGKSGVTFRSSAQFGIARYQDAGTAARTRLDIALGHGDQAYPDTTVMSLLSSGNVGIGTTSPVVPFHVLTSTTNTPGLFEHSGSVDSYLYIKNSAGGAYIASRTNDLSFHTSAGATERARIDSSGRLGLGTSNPQNLFSLGLPTATTSRILGQYGNNESPTLEVGVGQSSTFRGGMRIAVSDTGAGSVGDSVVSFHTTKDGGGTVQRLTIDQDGKVGVGTTSPETKLAVQSGSLTDGSILVGADYNGSGMSQNADKSGSISFPMYASDTYPKGFRGVMAYASSAVNFLQIGGGTNSARSATSVLFYTAPSVSANGTERVRIDSSGRLGLGTSSPSGLLHVQGVSGTYPTSIINHSAIDVEGEFLRVGRTDSVARYHSIYGKHSATSSSNYLQFRVHDGSASSPFTSQTTAMTLTGQGRVGVGTASPVAKVQISVDNSPTTNQADTLAVRGTSGSWAAHIGATSEGGALIARGNVSTKGQIVFGNTDGSYANYSETARIDTSGRLLVGTSSNTDDYKFQIDSASYKVAQFTRYGSDGAELALGSSRGTQGSKTALNNNDYGGLLTFKGYGGGNFQTLAWIGGVCDGQSPASGDSPGRLVFSTTSNSASSPTERLRITSDAYVRLASGTGGIQFNGDTAAANALDDYEEGTWTPTLRENGNSAIWNTLTTQEGAYIKIGKQVTVFFRIVYSGLPSNVNLSYYSYLAGLPFSGASNATNSQAINIAFLKSGADDTQYHLTWSNQGTTLNVFKSQDTNSPGPMTGSEYPSVQTTIRGHFVYKTV